MATRGKTWSYDEVQVILVSFTQIVRAVVVALTKPLRVAAMKNVRLCLCYKRNCAIRFLLAASLDMRFLRRCARLLCIHRKAKTITDKRNSSYAILLSIALYS